MALFSTHPLRLLILLFLTVVSGTSCTLADPVVADPPRLADEIKPADLGAERALILHYHRQDGEYDDWNIWAWIPDQEGTAYPLTGKSKFGRYAVIPLHGESARIGFLIRRGEWAEKDGDFDRFVDFGQDDTKEVWVVSGDPNVRADPGEVDLRPRAVAAFLDSEDAVTLALTAKLKPEQRDAIEVLVNGAASDYSVRELRPSARPATGRVMTDVVLDRKVAAEHLTKLTLRIPDLSDTTVFARDVLSSDAYSPPDAELGNRYTPEATTFRTWSPVSDSVELLLFADTDAEEPTSVVPLDAGKQGLWETTVQGDLRGVAYQYRFTNYGRTRDVADIHAFGANYNSSRSVVLDLDALAPEGWDDHALPLLKKPTDEVIYEIHVRDYSITDETCPPAYRGNYLGLIHENPGDPEHHGGVATGIDHLLELGVTSVHLLPIHDYGNERQAYNWGYWTALFNVPEASYASELHDPESAVRDLKAAILGLHQKDIRVILDVVYNHTATGRFAEAYETAVPYYYFRTTPDGRQRNDAGTGNSIADERPMVRKHILDSLAFWVEQYKVDGFRFDLLGTHYPETVAALEERLLSIRPDITLYGEPWTGGGPTYYPKGAQKGMTMSVFNDHLRNAIRGDLDGTAVGFASGPGGDLGEIQRGVMGAIDDFTIEPTETINYASAHDNLTLWDKLIKTAPDATDADHRAMQKLALGVVLTSQGVAFLHGGSDLARTKFGEHNSYNKGDEINAFDWSRKAEYRDVFDFVAGMVAIRRAHPAFRMHDDAQIREHLHFLPAEGLVAYALNGEAVGDTWKQIVVVYNGDPQSKSFTLPDGAWSVAAESGRASAEALSDQKVGGEVAIRGYSVAVFFRD